MDIILIQESTVESPMTSMTARAVNNDDVRCLCVCVLLSKTPEQFNAAIVQLRAVLRARILEVENRSTELLLDFWDTRIGSKPGSSTDGSRTPR